MPATIPTAVTNIRHRTVTRNTIQDAAVGWLLARIVILAAFVTARIIDTNNGFGERGRLDEGLLVWDGTWYRAIAEDGFGQSGEGVRFAPLFAWLGHVAGFVAGGNDAVGLVVVSNLAALGAGVALAYYGTAVARASAQTAAQTAARTAARTAAQTAASDVARRDQARMIGLAVGLSPASFVFVLAYAESLLVLAAALAALAARRHHWLLAAAAGFVAGAARPTGMAVSILLTCLAYVAIRGASNSGTASGTTSLSATNLVSMFAAALSPVVGFGSHLLASQLLAGSWRDPITIQSPLRGDFVDPFSRFATGIADLAGRDPFGDGLHLPFAVFAIVLIWLVWREIGVPEAAYSAAVVLVSLSAQNWNSLERYTINAFPVLVAMGLWLSRQGRWRYPIVATSSLVMASLMVMSWSGRYVP